jgi:hypothetical protein
VVNSGSKSAALDVFRRHRASVDFVAGTVAATVTENAGGIARVRKERDRRVNLPHQFAASIRRSIRHNAEKKLFQIRKGLGALSTGRLTGARRPFCALEIPGQAR